MKCISSINSECRFRWGEKTIVLSGGANRAGARLSNNYLQNVNNNNIAVPIHILPHCSLKFYFRFDSNILLLL